MIDCEQKRRNKFREISVWNDTLHLYSLVCVDHEIPFLTYGPAEKSDLCNLANHYRVWAWSSIIKNVGVDFEKYRSEIMHSSYSPVCVDAVNCFVFHLQEPAEKSEQYDLAIHHKTKAWSIAKKNVGAVFEKYPVEWHTHLNLPSALIMRVVNPFVFHL